MAAYDASERRLMVQVADEGREIDIRTESQLQQVFALKTDQNHDKSVGEDNVDEDELFRSLNICKEIVAINSGEIEFFSQGHGRGVTF